jgi:hypothetical protein
VNTDVMTRFLKPLMAIYGGPKHVDDTEGFLAIYSRILKGYAPEVLDKAADRILRNHKYKSWPTPAECEAACKYEADELQRAKDRAKQGPTRRADYDENTKRRWAEAEAWQKKVCDEHGSIDNYLKKFKPKNMFEGRK